MQCGENKIEKLQLGRFIKSATAKAWNISRELNKGIKTARIEETTIAPQKKITYSPSTQGSVSTSLKFFERKPSKISEAERLGFGRRFNPQSGEDLHQFYSLQDRRQTMRDALKKLKAPKDMGVDETISKNSGATVDDGYLVSGGYRYNPVSETSFKTGHNMSFDRQSGHNYGLNLGGQSTRVKDLDNTSEIVYSRPGANLDRQDPLNSEIVITSADNERNKKGIQLLTKAMRDMESGAEFSGDASSTTASEALYQWLKIAKNRPDLRDLAMSKSRAILRNGEGIPLRNHTINDPLHGITTKNATMSPDAYSYFYRTARNNSDKFHLGYQMNAGRFNSFARNPKNSFMYDVEQQYLDGLITPKEYVRQFNSWSVPLGGRRAYVYEGQLYKPQPFLIRNKRGGIMKKVRQS